MADPAVNYSLPLWVTGVNRQRPPHMDIPFRAESYGCFSAPGGIRSAAAPSPLPLSPAGERGRGEGGRGRITRGGCSMKALFASVVAMVSVALLLGATGAGEKDAQYKIKESM